MRLRTVSGHRWRRGRAQWLFRGARKFEEKISKGAPFRFIALHWPQRNGQCRLQESAAEREPRGNQCLLRGQGLRRVNQQCNQADHSEVCGRCARSHQHSRRECPHRGDDHGRHVVTPGEHSEENGKRAQSAGGEHPFGALRVGIAPVGVSHVERPASYHDAATRHIQSESHNERQDHADRIAQGHVRRQSRRIEARQHAQERARSAFVGGRRR